MTQPIDFTGKLAIETDKGTAIFFAGSEYQGVRLNCKIIRYEKNLPLEITERVSGTSDLSTSKGPVAIWVIIDPKTETALVHRMTAEYYSHVIDFIRTREDSEDLFATLKVFTKSVPGFLPDTLTQEEG